MNALASVNVRLLLPVMVAALAILGGVLDATSRSAGTPAGPPHLAVSPAGSDAGDCSQAHPCQTFQKAYSVAAAGQTVDVLAGTYPAQTIDAVAGRTTAAQPNITFTPAPGAFVRVPALSLGDSLSDDHGPSNLTIEGIKGGTDSTRPCGWQMLLGATNIVWDNDQACDFYVNGVTHATIKDSTFGGCTQATTDSPPCSYNAIDANPRNRDITLDGDTLHDDHIAPGATDVHMQCLFVGGSINLTIRNSTFYNCDIFDIFLQYGSSVAPANFDGLVIENNNFGPALTGDGQDRPTALWFSARGYRFNDVVVRSNSFIRSSIGFDGDGPDPTDFVVQQNILLVTTCIRGVNFTQNIWFGTGGCGADSIVKLPLGYELTPDGHLRLLQPQARAVRAIFTDCARGMSPAQISRLFAANASFRRVGHWHGGTIKGIAANQAYLGGIAGAQGASPALTWTAQFTRAAKTCGS